MVDGLWRGILVLCLFCSVQPAKAQLQPGSDAHLRLDKCGPKSDRRFTVCRGAWSGKTIALFNTWSAPDSNPERRLRLFSPDGQKLIIVNGFRVRIRIDGKLFWTPFGSMHDAEVGWAPDSTRLFVTWSESGELGPWHVQVFDVTVQGLREIEGVTRSARKDILKREHHARLPNWVKGQYREMWHTLLGYCEPDMIGSQWLSGSKEILVAARTGPDSGCKYMAEVVTYRLDAETGEIRQAYKEREAHNIFGNDDLPIILDKDDEDADILWSNHGV